MLPEISMKELLEAGVHFGHPTKRWNPKMKRFIFGSRNGIYIIDLQKTLKCFKEALQYVSELSRQGGRLLLVGTKRQAQDVVIEEAGRDLKIALVMTLGRCDADRARDVLDENGGHVDATVRRLQKS